MKIYRYDKDGLLIGEFAAKESPLEPGVYRIPANATTKTPIGATGDYERDWFVNGTWGIAKDYRGVPFYLLPDRSPQYVTELNEVPPAEAVFELPPPTQDELDAIQAEIDRINAILAAQENEGLKSYTVEQAHTYIDNQIDGATTQAETVEAIRRILKKMVPYLLS